uniref:metallophosphoesterase n=1 Tax=Methylobacterium sp. TaxID=409 RepID=UPI0020C887A4|nr:metallophosphoesterase [Methylobacterium sp.]USU34561.1 metallophosphoesterase [Methylobacterium sp.]
MQANLVVDTLHVVSDFHLGGKAGFQIFRAKAKFEVLVRALLDEARERRVGFVINGDFVDFLAEEPAAYFDAANALDKLRRILADPSFVGVATGVRELLASPNVSVAIALGNHDVELALPWVAEGLMDALSGHDQEARSRLTLETAGLGISACVGSAKVLCLHGNEFDEWNVTDYEALRRSARAMRWGASTEPYAANAGTRLVVDVMNAVKVRYPFVDLLKPETGAVLPLLLALDPSLARRIPDAVGTIPKLARDTVRWRAGYLGDPGAGTTHVVGPRIHPDILDGPLTDRERSEVAARLLDRTEDRMRDGVDARALASSEQGNDLLGIGGALRRLVERAPRSEVLREAIDYLDADRSFDRSEIDTTFRRADQEVPPNVDVVVTGHTHLERVLRRRNGKGYYFNSGTWASLMRIEPLVRRDPAAFEKFLGKLAGRDLNQLDADGLLISHPAVVSVRKEGGRVVAGLRHVGTALKPFEAVGGEFEVA